MTTETTIRISPLMLEFVNDEAKTKIVIEPNPGKDTHGLKWYTVESYEIVRGNNYVLGSRYDMPATGLEHEYKMLSTPQMSIAPLDTELVSFQAFKALVASLKF